MKSCITIVTRKSPLALAQTKQVEKLLQTLHPKLKTKVLAISTKGDQAKEPLWHFRGEGVFVKELETSLIKKESDLAVHSLKDMPKNQPKGLTIAAYLKREDPKDILLIKEEKTFEELSKHSIIGTSSPRRMMNLEYLKKQFIFKAIRGNIETRIKKLKDPREPYHAIVMANAAIKRLGLHYTNIHFFSTSDFIPAPGQGIIAIECATENKTLIKQLKQINDTETEICAKAERMFMNALNASCQSPLSAYAYIKKNRLYLKTLVSDEQRKNIIPLYTDFKIEEAREKILLIVEVIKKKLK